MTAITVKLPDQILSLLRTTGLTAARAAEILGVGQRQAAHLLRKAGAVRGSHGLMFYFPSVERIEKANKRLANPGRVER